MNEEHKDKSSRPEERFSELGQQAGAVLGQLFAAAEQFGQQVSKESEAWSESGASREPFVSALRQASEEFRATANRAAENFSDAFQQGQANPADDDLADGSDVAGDRDIKPGSVHKIGGGAVRGDTQNSESSDTQSDAFVERPKFDGSTDRVEQLAEIFRGDSQLEALTAEQFDALKAIVAKQYRSVREFQDRMAK